MTKKLTIILFPACLFIAISASVGFAEVRLARPFSDHAVLQRSKPIPVWGWSEPNDPIRVSLASQNLSTTADDEGRWRVVFDPIEAVGPFELKVSGHTDSITIKDILIGEVWLCSGQSNMEWTVRQSQDFEREKSDSNFPNIRHFYIDHEIALEPKSEIRNGTWRSASSETVGDFTAVGFFFARRIHKELGVPVGLIHSSWGGSQIEGWISREGLFGSDEFNGYAKALPITWEAAELMLERRLKQKTLGDENAGPTLADEKNYTKPGYDFSKWHKGNAMWQWDWQGIWAWRGNGYLAKIVTVPSEFEEAETVLGLAEGHNYNEIYINGKNVFAGILKGKREIKVPGNTWKAGENRLVIKMNKMIEPEWFGLGLMGSSDGLFVKTKEAKIQIDPNGWSMMPAFAEDHAYARLSNNFGTAIYNAMIAPIVPYSIRGVLWYQGETNAGRSYQYRKTFPLLIQDWRRKWNDEFPFYFVQLSSFGADRSSNEGSGWAELREAQTMALSLPNTGMAVTIDIGNKDDVHPVNKQDVGKRLALNALKLTYGRDVIYSGPMYDSVRFQNGNGIVKFRFIGGGLKAHDKFGYLKGFEIAGADRKFYYAKAEIRGNEVVVSNPYVSMPAAVRYAWSDAPVDANLFNSEGLPASPFRTDDWPGVTVNNKFQ